MGTQHSGTHTNGNPGEVFISEEPRLPEGATEEDRKKERIDFCRILYELRYQYSGYPDREKHMNKRDAIEFQQYMRSFGIDHLSPEMRERFDREYQNLPAEEQRNGWDQVIESTAVAHFTPEDHGRYRRYKEKFKNKFADNWCMKVASQLERLVDDLDFPHHDAALRSLFSDNFRKKIQIIVRKLYHSIGYKENRQPTDIGEINAAIDAVLAALYPEIQNRSAQATRKRLEEILGIGDSQKS